MFSCIEGDFRNAHRCSLISSTRIIHTLPFYSLCLQHSLKGSLLINIGIKRTKMGLDINPDLILSGVWIGCLRLWCSTKGTHTDWSHAWYSHSLTWKQMIASVEENPEWTRFRKHISNAGLPPLYVLGIVFIMLPVKGHSGKDKSAAILRLVGECSPCSGLASGLKTPTSVPLFMFCCIAGLLNMNRTIY